MIPVLKVLVPTASMRQICAAMSVSRSWYYASLATPTRTADVELVQQIEPIVRRFPGYGYRRVTAALHRSGIQVNHKRVQRVMREYALLFRVRRTLSTTKRATAWQHTPNLVAGRPLTGPNQVWVADMTYIHLRRETGFLACVLDAWSRRCVGWAMGRELTTDLSLKALELAIARRSPGPGLIHHSDQGVQYANHRYAAVLTRIGATMSMAAAGTPTQNAIIERFIRTIKDEEVYRNEYRDMADAEHRIGVFIDQIYNRERLHARLGNRPPAEFEMVATMDAVIPAP
jgi:transposase InsO family protein